MIGVADSQISLSEIEAIAFKASRGQGLSWGMAEEAAYATRWLTEQGFDGPTLLHGQLDQRSRAPSSDTGPNMGADTPPVISAGNWSLAGPNPLCPIVTGVALNDFGFLPEGPMRDRLTIGPLASPVMLLPFVGMIAASADAVFRVEWAESSVIIYRSGICEVLNAAGFLIAETAALRITPCKLPSVMHQTKARVGTPKAALSALDRYACKTYVPASDHSRRNAGASGSDEQ